MTPKVERLVNLTIALLEARRPMSFEDIKQRTGFYGQADAETARRMFERDKKLLRSVGVPIETSTAPLSDEVGYRIPRPDYELPDLDLTAEEVAALGLALQLTDAEHSRVALAKLAARAPDPGELDPVPRTHVRLETAVIDEVADAVVSRTPLVFTYRTAAGVTRERTVHPHAIAMRRGAWYLVGHDRDREALRVFRFDRMVDRPRPSGQPGSFSHPEELDVAGLVAGPEGDRVDVEVAVSEAARFEVALRGAHETGRQHAGRAVLVLPGLDPLRDTAWLLGFGAEVEVLAPPQLRAEVAAGHARVAAVHAAEPQP